MVTSPDMRVSFSAGSRAESHDGARGRTIPSFAMKRDQSLWRPGAAPGRPGAAPGSLRRAQLPREVAIAAAAAQRAVVVGIRGVVAVADEVGDGRIAQHASAVRQRRAAEAQ